MVETNRFTFKKAERLTHKILIGKLFSEGKGFICYPFRIVWKEAELNSEYPAQVAITVSKRSFKKAVTRNLLKRRIREIYRLQKGELYKKLDNKNAKLAFMIVYLPKTILSSAEMEGKLSKGLNRLFNEYEKHSQLSDQSDSVHHDSSN
jgi:ribonuclease P protein component